MVCLDSFVLPQMFQAIFCFWLHLAESSRNTIDCSPQANVSCTVYTYNDCAVRRFESRHPDLFSGSGPALPIKLNVYQSSIDTDHNSTSRPALTVFWWPLSHYAGEFKGYEISMQGIRGVAKGVRKCFVIDTRNSNVMADTQTIYNFTLSPVFSNSVYHFRIISLPHMRSRGSASSATMETWSDSSRIVPSEWTTRVECEVRSDLHVTKVYVEYDLPPRAFKFPGVNVELVLNNNVISKQLSTKPFHLFETMKHGNFQIWITPEDPFIYSPRACLCRNSDDVCAGSCVMSYGYCDVIMAQESIGEAVKSPDGLPRPLTICLTVAVVIICAVVTVGLFSYRYCKGRKGKKCKSETCSMNNGEHVCTFVPSGVTEEPGSCTTVSYKHTDLINKPMYYHMADRKDQYLHSSLLKDSLSNGACPELISLGGQSV
ncbi:uncharacterized protein [Argopecten irradians]|uniref:uncharacterized protein isoform X2 n=1 Tax=Argopecten irradians TaxID=31199 RepID=UPI003722507B